MKTLKAIPLSRARTALGLMQAVKRAILSEPKQANITVYVKHRDRCDGGPDCGTVGCVAGWIGLLSGMGRIIGPLPVVKLLGRQLSYWLPTERTHPDSIIREDDTFDVFNSGRGDACNTTVPGTKAHAKAVVHRIDGFIEANYNALKRRKLPSLKVRKSYNPNSETL